DEEVFLGLMGENIYSSLNQTQVNTLFTNTGPFRSLSAPTIATQYNPGVGAPTGYIMQSNGYIDECFLDVHQPGYPAHTTPAPQHATRPPPTHFGQALKAAFSDFLVLRHGGSGYLFAYGNGNTGQLNAAERPFRSLAYPDINYTIFRPAALPPSLNTLPQD